MVIRWKGEEREREREREEGKRRKKWICGECDEGADDNMGNNKRDHRPFCRDDISSSGSPEMSSFRGSSHSVLISHIRNYQIVAGCNVSIYLISVVTGSFNYILLLVETWEQITPPSYANPVISSRLTHWGGGTKLFDAFTARLYLNHRYRRYRCDFKNISLKNHAAKCSPGNNYGVSFFYNSSRRMDLLAGRVYPHAQKVDRAQQEEVEVEGERESGSAWISSLLAAAVCSPLSPDMCTTNIFYRPSYHPSYPPPYYSTSPSFQTK